MRCVFKTFFLFDAKPAQHYSIQIMLCVLVQYFCLKTPYEEVVYNIMTYSTGIVLSRFIRILIHLSTYIASRRKAKEKKHV